MKEIASMSDIHISFVLFQFLSILWSISRVFYLKLFDEGGEASESLFIKTRSNMHAFSDQIIQIF